MDEAKDRKFPKVGVAVFILRDGKILMSERLSGNGAGTWGLPGGHLEMGETFDGCCKREVMEETGLVVDGIRFLTVVNKGIVESGDHYITLFFVADECVGEPMDREPAKHGPWGWFSPDSLPETCFENFKPMVKRYFS